jgi:hypothetical protein
MHKDAATLNVQVPGAAYSPQRAVVGDAFDCAGGPGYAKTLHLREIKHGTELLIFSRRTVDRLIFRSTRAAFAQLDKQEEVKDRSPAMRDKPPSNLQRRKS